MSKHKTLQFKLLEALQAENKINYLQPYEYDLLAILLANGKKSTEGDQPR